MSYFTLLTKVGQALIATAHATGTPVKLTHLAVGDGDGAQIIPREDMTALRREVWRGALNTLSEDPQNPGWIMAEAVVPENSGGFTIREVGLFDESGTLVAVGSLPDSYKPQLAEGSAKTFYIRMRIEIGNASSVTLLIDPSVVLATKEFVAIEVGRVRVDLDALASDVGDHVGNLANPHQVTAAQAGAETAGAVHAHDQSAVAHPDIRAAIAGIVIPVATAEAKGIVERATSGEVLAGADQERYVCPADMAAAMAGVVRAYTRQQYAAPVVRAGASGAQAVDLDLHPLLFIDASGALTMADPEHMAAGKTCVLLLYSAAAQTISWSTAWRGTSLVSLPTALAAGKLLIISALCVTTAAGTYMVPVGMVQEA